MHNIRIHKVINHLISFFYHLGIWHRGDKPTARERTIMWLYSFYYSLFTLAMLFGPISDTKIGESIFTKGASIMGSVLAVKFWVLIWKQKEILVLLNGISVFSIRNYDNYTFSTNKLESFMKFVLVFLSISCLACTFTGVVVPLLGSERNLLFEIAFPLDYKNDETAFWMAYCFLITETLLSLVPIANAVIIWYLKMCCSLRYKVLGREIKCMGRIVEQEKAKMSEKEIHRIFLQDLKVAIVAHRHLKGLIDEFQSFAVNLFFMQFCTSAICICTTIYCLAFDISKNLLERLIFVYAFFYNISELFMITYLGNEIKLSSNRLSYSLFESQWIEQPQITNKYIILFGEYLKQPHELLIGKLYPLTLETFTKILNSSYSMFNILKTA